MTRVEMTPGQSCSCPEANGMTYHRRGNCTDPVVARLGWYADDCGDTIRAGLGFDAWCSLPRGHDGAHESADYTWTEFDILARAKEHARVIW